MVGGSEPVVLKGNSHKSKQPAALSTTGAEPPNRRPPNARL
jgi:hypothetical protein